MLVVQAETNMPILNGETIWKDGQRYRLEGITTDNKDVLLMDENFVMSAYNPKEFGLKIVAAQPLCSKSYVHKLKLMRQRNLPGLICGFNFEHEYLVGSPVKYESAIWNIAEFGYEYGDDQYVEKVLLTSQASGAVLMVTTDMLETRFCRESVRDVRSISSLTGPVERIGGMHVIREKPTEEDAVKINDTPKRKRSKIDSERKPLCPESVSVQEVFLVLVDIAMPGKQTGTDAAGKPVFKQHQILHTFVFASQPTADSIIHEFVADKTVDCGVYRRDEVDRFFATMLTTFGVPKLPDAEPLPGVHMRSASVVWTSNLSIGDEHAVGAPVGRLQLLKKRMIRT